MTIKIKAALDGVFSPNSIIANYLTAAYDIKTIASLLKDLGVSQIHFGGGQWYGVSKSHDVSVICAYQVDDYPLHKFLADVMAKAGILREFWNYLDLVKGSTLFGIRDEDSYFKLFTTLSMSDKMTVVKVIRDFIKKRRAHLIGMTMMTIDSGSQMSIVFGKIPTTDTYYWTKLTGFDISTLVSAAKAVKTSQCSKRCFNYADVNWSAVEAEWGKAATRSISKYEFLVCTDN